MSIGTATAQLRWRMCPRPRCPAARQAARPEVVDVLVRQGMQCQPAWHRHTPAGDGMLFGSAQGIGQDRRVPNWSDEIPLTRVARVGRLAQVVRAARLQRAGRGFESLSAHH
jgi:hypothetical protein